MPVTLIIDFEIIVIQIVFELLNSDWIWIVVCCSDFHTKEINVAAFNQVNMVINSYNMKGST